MLCDSHVHVVGPAALFSLAANRAYLPDPAPLAGLRAHAAKRGVERFVIVQPSFYGVDNAMLAHALSELGGAGRGVAMIDPDACDFEALTELDRAGVRGLRINLYTRPHGGALPPLGDVFSGNVNAAAAMGWHVEVIAPMAIIAEHGEMLAQSPVPIVLDHYALHSGHAPKHGAGKQVVGLVRQAHVWVKLSAPYRCRDDELATKPDRAWLEAFLEAAPDRCVWGSDWPFTPDESRHRGPELGAPYRALRYEEVVDGFVSSIADAKLARRLMEDNPARLYEFAEGGAT